MVELNIQIPVKELEQLPWLVCIYPHLLSLENTSPDIVIQTVIVKESLRITALVTSRLPLVAPKSPLTYDTWEIPSGVGSFSRSILSNDLMSS